MKIGIFDSGLGGLIITRSLIQHLPNYDYLYLGDTARVPYGNRSQKTILQFTLQAVDYLFKQDCQLIIIACNTASAEALAQIQQEYLPKTYPDRRVLGVIIPTVEQAVQAGSQSIGILATASTVNSQVFVAEIKKILPQAKIFQQAAPLLVPLIENNNSQFAPPFLDYYLAPLQEKEVDCLILGCTHYPFLKEEIAQKMGRKVKIIAQNEILPFKLATYLTRHPEIESRLGKSKSYQLLVTDLTENIQALSTQLFQKTIQLELVNLNNENQG